METKVRDPEVTDRCVGSFSQHLLAISPGPVAGREHTLLVLKMYAVEGGRPSDTHKLTRAGKGHHVPCREWAY